ncbi:PilZ domain-containing protein [Enterovibrio baiacu]
MNTKILPEFRMMQDQDRTLYDQLLPLYEKADFDAQLTLLTPNLSNSERLLIKMEIRRLMSPFLRPIDLRGKVQGECRSYTLSGLTHWMDDVALNLYHRRLDIYQGQLTQGLWDELHSTPNSHRVLQRTGGTPTSQQENFVSLDADALRFGHYLLRSEHRIQLNSQVQVFLPDGTEVNGTTLDISNSGMRIKLPAAFQYEVGTVLTVYFPQLGDECQIPELFTGIDYRLVGVEINLVQDNFRRLRLRLITSTEAIKEAIDVKSKSVDLNTITENKDKLISTRTRSYEKIYLEKTPSLPLFFCGNALRYCLLTEQNRALWDYWHDERNQPVIDRLFSPERMQNLALEGLNCSETLVYCFSHEHTDKTYFFSACPTEMSTELRHLFWHIGSARPSWRVLRVTMTKISEEDAIRLQEVSPAYIHQIDELTHIATIQDLTLAHSNTDFRHPLKPKIPAKSLNQYLHPRTSISAIEAVPSLLAPQRKEPRYKHRTGATLIHHVSGEIQAQTVDFSSSGLNLKLTRPFSGTKAQEVAITFNDFKRVDPKAPLGNVPYKVVRISEDRTNVTLVLIKDRHSRHRSEYLQRLIEHNQHRLILDSEKMPDPPLVEAMHQMLLTRLSATPYFLCKKGENLQLAAVGINYPGNELSRLLESPSQQGLVSLSPVLGEHIAKLSASILRQRNRLTQIKHEFYVAVQFENNAVIDIKARILESFASPEERRFFVSQARKKGKFFAVRNWLQPINEGGQYLNSAVVEEIMMQSSMKARQLESEFIDLCVYGEITDVTDEVLLRL